MSAVVLINQHYQHMEFKKRGFEKICRASWDGSNKCYVTWIVLHARMHDLIDLITLDNVEAGVDLFKHGDHV
jgi:hypothetical protein